MGDDQWITRHLVRAPRSARVRIHAGIYAVALVWLGLVAIASASDGTLHLPGNGKGLLDHYGYLVLHLATPVALSLSLLVVSSFLRLLDRFEQFLLPLDAREQVLALRDVHAASLNLRSIWVWLLVLFIIVGALCSATVLAQVLQPVDTYGNDVFNAFHYRWGYYVANTYLATAWTLVFPVSLFAVLHVTVSLTSLLAVARRQRLLRVDLLHADGCGGLSPFGAVNLLAMLYYLPPFLAMIVLADTHSSRYASLIIPALLLSLSFVVQSVLAVYAIHLAIRDEKALRLNRLREHLYEALDHPLTTTLSPVAVLLWDHVHGVRTMPYAGHVRATVSVLRYAPPALAVVRLLL